LFRENSKVERLFRLARRGRSTQPRTLTEAALGRIAAGTQLAMMIAVWLVLWLPLAVYCLVAAVIGALRSPRRAFQATPR
jgi:type VI protein secretion system component VasF